jgi:hypothetical protein
VTAFTYRVLVDVFHRDLATTVLGQMIASAGLSESEAVKRRVA